MPDFLFPRLVFASCCFYLETLIEMFKWDPNLRIFAGPLVLKGNSSFGTLIVLLYHKWKAWCQAEPLSSSRICRACKNSPFTHVCIILRCWGPSSFTWSYLDKFLSYIHNHSLVALNEWFLHCQTSTLAGVIGEHLPHSWRDTSVSEHSGTYCKQSSGYCAIHDTEIPSPNRI